MNRYEQTELVGQRVEMRVREIAGVGCGDSAALTLNDIRLLCEALITSFKQRDDVVLQPRIPPSGTLPKDAVGTDTNN